jgi:alpha-D-xyloside xylohydrolase
MRKTLTVGLFLILCYASYQCSFNKPRVTPISNGIQLKSGDLNLKVQFYDDDIVRIIKWIPQGSYKKLSLSVFIDSLPELKININENSDSVTLKSSKLIVTVSKTDGKIKYNTINNNPLLKEKDKAVFTPVIYVSDTGFSVEQNFELTSDEGIYGFGQQQNGFINYRGKEIKLVQTKTDAVIPLLLSTNGYGILWDNYSKTVFKDTDDETSLWSEMANNIDYYFIAGENMDKIISGYRNLTGKAPMYGKWAYGYWQGKVQNSTPKELKSIANKYRNLKMPADVITQDWAFLNGQENWNGKFFDSSIAPNSQCRKFKKCDLYSIGLDGWQSDSTDTDEINAFTKESTEYDMKKVGSNYLGSWARYLNTFSLSMTDSIYKFLREEPSARRAFVITRSTFAGQQRDAVTTWSGDIGASWDIYRHQISIGINHSISGIPYWTFDIGGSVPGANEGVFCNGVKDPAYQELYVRMFQFGAFCPIFRSHGPETPIEIREMGGFIQPIIKFDKLRFRLLPYIYSLAWKVTNDNYTIMRGLPMDFAADENSYSIDNQFMFGPSIMICPVTGYMYHRPPESSVLIGSEYFLTDEGKPGLNAKYYKDNKYTSLGKEQTDPNIDIFWYTGRPDFVTDSMFSIRWVGNIVPKESGKYQFHLKCFDAKRIILDGKQLPIIYNNIEQYTDLVMLKAGKKYKFVLETENKSKGIARMQLFWKTPETFSKEKSNENVDKTRVVYLPANTIWYDFWTGVQFEGGRNILCDAPINKIPLLIKAGSIIPLGPFIQFSIEKPADPIELRIYPGANGNFNLYEDENDNYNYEKGIYATIEFKWDNAAHQLTIGKRKGEFPGMLKERTFKIILVEKDHGTGIEITRQFDKEIKYMGDEIFIKL